MKYLTNADNILRSVDIVFQVLQKCTPQYGGMFPAVTERQNGQLLMDQPLPATIPGQRNSDRSPRGSNLQHDIPLIGALDGLDKALDRPRYQKLRTDYLEAFATVCAPPSPTGLLPWGEHSFWDLHKGKIGNSYLLQYLEQPLDAGIETHHQLHELPFEDWKVIHAANPEALPRFVDGLDWHWQDDERTQFNRHAGITQFIRGYQNKRHAKIVGDDFKPGEKKDYGGDFPGAAGVFIHDYACALALVENPKPAWKQQLLRFSDNWWERRLDCGIFAKSGGGKAHVGADPGQTLSHALSLLNSAEALKEADPELSQLLHERGKALTNSLLDFEQPEAEQGKLCVQYGPDLKPIKWTRPWGGDRGNPVAARIMVNLLAAASLAGDVRGAELAERVAEAYRESFIPRDLIVRAGDLGAVIGLLGEAARTKGDEESLKVALSHATDALELYFDSPMPRCATGRKHYESQLGSSALIHALARLVVIAEGYGCKGGLARPMVQ